jgi:hypothetical protein
MDGQLDVLMRKNRKFEPGELIAREDGPWRSTGGGVMRRYRILGGVGILQV